MTARLVVLASGNGTNLQAILDACAAKRLDAEVAGVVCNTDAYAVRRAEADGVAAVVLASAGVERSVYDTKLAEVVAGMSPDFVVLAGWMRILTMNFLSHFRGRVVNLHPALPGAFPGVRAIERAYTAYQAGEIAGTGIMVHLVPDEEVDAGPVIRSLEVAILPDDSLEDLEARMHAEEHEILVAAIGSLIAQEVQELI
ncbi:MAG: phosphoribosylglycinamide formyltransferase [Acidimicrobiales bacterium]